YNQAHGDPTFIEHTPAGGPYDLLTAAYDVTSAQYNQAHGDPTFIEHTPAGGPYDLLTAAYDVTSAQYNQAHGDQTSSLSWQDSSSGLPAALSSYAQPEAQNAHYQPPHGDQTSDRSGPGSSSNSTFRPQNAAPHNLELPQEGPGSSLHRFNNPRLKLSADEQQAEAKARADSARKIQQTRDRATMLRNYFNKHILRPLDKKEGKEGKKYPYIPKTRKENGKTEEFRAPGPVLREVDKVLQARRDAGMKDVPNLAHLTGNKEEALRQAEQFAQLEKDSNADQRSDEDETPADKRKRRRERAAMLRKYINEHHLRPRDLKEGKEGKEGTKYPYLTTISERTGKDGKKLRLLTAASVLREVPKVLQKRKDAGMENVPKLTYLTNDQKKSLRNAALFKEQGADYQSDGDAYQSDSAAYQSDSAAYQSDSAAYQSDSAAYQSDGE
ncbi:hypothetical protein, partial [Dictyobacter arantiisoli]|uniref:hypothetical protein n=1 Tax=Dictyobacter arantiisoli TaxID=2014874 RepID=UPI00155B2FA6